MYEQGFIHNVSLDKYFRTLPNQPVEDPNLSFAAKGLLWYLLSRGENWRTRVHHLASLYVGKKRGNGTDAIYSMLDELREAGYVIYERSRDDKGRWVHTYHVYPMPYETFKKMFPQPVKPEVVQPDMVKPDITTSNELPSNELPKELVCSEPPLAEEASRLKIPISCEKLHPDGHKMHVSREDLISQSILAKDNFTLAEIDQAWQALLAAPKVRDPYAFLKGTIKNIRNSNSYPAITKKAQEKTCTQTIQNTKKKQQPTKGVSLADVMKARALARSTNLEKKSPDS